MADFRMPSLGADMEEGTVLEWLVAPGDTVHRGDVMAVVDTSKAAVEVESFIEGVVGELLVAVGTTVPVGTPLARVTDGTEASGVVEPGRVAGPAVAAEPAVVAAATQPPDHPSPTTPLIRTLAAELGVDLATVTGTGSHGRVTRKDVQRAAAAAPAASHPPRRAATPYARRVARELGVDLADVQADGVIDADDVRRSARAGEPTAAPPAAPTHAEPASRPAVRTAPQPAAARQDLMRQTIGRLMARSKREIPHYYLSTTVDLARARGWMQERNRELPVSGRLVPAALLLKATALAVRRHPQLNGFWVDDAFVAGSGVHLGVAISLRGGGLVAPAIHDADTLTVEQLMAAMRDLVGRARAGRLRGTEMSDPTLTVTNLGDQGVESVLGVIYPPQVALVGFGRVLERPWAVDGMLTVRPVVSLTLAADHRATDGFVGGRLLAAIDTLLQSPEEL